MNDAKDNMFATGHAADVDAALAQLTLVIPVGPGDTLAPELRLQLCDLPPHTCLRVVCARETDATLLRAAMAVGKRPSNWEILIAPAGRATQQNFGARGAGTAYLWFLHADSRLAGNTLAALARFVASEERAMGYFDLRFLDDGPRLVRLNELGAWVRSHWLGLPFGDQGLVLPRVAFEDLGGFATRLPSGEDHDLVLRARRAGLPVRPLRAIVYTSARKYAERGWWRTTREHLVATCRQAHRFSRVLRTPEGA
ncbi:MAG TPA: glycosyl transferase family 2 [Lysobacter sp.]|nr:glycosyl transferase family 2 [Lysobacter sp.]